MRFDSIASLYQFLNVFNYLGYLYKPTDFKSDMTKKGLKYHISRYTVSVESNMLNDSFIITFHYFGDSVYTIVLNHVYEKK